MSINIYEMVTDRILQQLENNVVAWKKNWQGGVPVNYITQKPYHGINLLLLPFGGEWLTFKQAQESGGNVRKGEKSSIIVFYKLLEKDKNDDEDSEEKEKIPFLRYSNVFHISQCENIPTKIKPVTPDHSISPINNAENTIQDYIKRSGIDFKNISGSNRAYYSPSQDMVVMPEIKQFTSSEGYYGTTFHELAHSTGHKSRLDRISKDASFGNADYSKEELVAEISACMIMNFMSIEIPQTFENSIAYIQAWKKVLKADNKIIISASSQAQKATNLILNITNTQD